MSAVERYDDDDASSPLPDITEAVLQMTAGNEELAMFVDAVGTGIPKYLAGASVGWSPAQVDAKMKDPGFRSLVKGAEDLSLDGVELALLSKARRGHVAAAQFVLTNRRPGAWAERRQLDVKHETTISDGDRDAIKAGLIQIMRDGENRAAIIDALHHDAIEAASVENQS